MNSDDPRGRRDGHPPRVSADELNAAIEALMGKTDGPPMPRARALGALLFMTEQTIMFDTDRLDADEMRAGYMNMAMIAGMSHEDQQRQIAGTVVPMHEFTEGTFRGASFVFARMIENRLNTTLLDIQEMIPGICGTGEFNIMWPVVEWLHAVCALAPLVNVARVPAVDVARAAKVANQHAATARQHLARLLDLAQR